MSPAAPPPQMTARERRQRTSTFVTAGLVLFAALFVGLATLLGPLRYVPRSPPPLPARSAEEAALAAAFDTSSELGRPGFVLPKGPAAWEAQVAALAGDPEPEARGDRALLLLLLGQPGEAEAAVGDPGSSPRLRLLRAMALERAQAPGARIRVAAEALLEVAPRSPEAHLMLARLALADGELPMARRHAEAARDEAPAWAEAHRLLGRIALRDGDAARAKAAYRLVLELRPLDPEAARLVRSIDGN
jgi:tetratricopeptide (TPR) repeat protein